VGVFGEGTYLSSELSVSLHYSPMGRSWERSNLGDKLSCVAVCEMIDDPSVKCQVKNSKYWKVKAIMYRQLKRRNHESSHEVIYKNKCFIG
jgi:poly[ADP-ribose] polymerase 16